MNIIQIYIRIVGFYVNKISLNLLRVYKIRLLRFNMTFDVTRIG